MSFVAELRTWLFPPPETAEMREAQVMQELEERFPHIDQFITEGGCLGLRFKVLMDEYVGIIRDNKPDSAVPYIRIMNRLYETWKS